MKFAFAAEDVATDAVNAFGLFDVGAASSGGVADVVFVASVIVVVTTLSASKFSFAVSKFIAVVSKFNFVGGVGGVAAVATIVFGVDADANDESTTMLSCLSLLSSLRLVVDATLSFFSLPLSIDVMLKMDKFNSIDFQYCGWKCVTESLTYSYLRLLHYRL